MPIPYYAKVALALTFITSLVGGAITLPYTPREVIKSECVTVKKDDGYEYRTVVQFLPYLSNRPVTQEKGVSSTLRECLERARDFPTKD